MLLNNNFAKIAFDAANAVTIMTPLVVPIRNIITALHLIGLLELKVLLN